MRVTFLTPILGIVVSLFLLFYYWPISISRGTELTQARKVILTHGGSEAAFARIRINILDPVEPSPSNEERLVFFQTKDGMGIEFLVSNASDKILDIATLCPGSTRETGRQWIPAEQIRIDQRAWYRWLTIPIIAVSIGMFAWQERQRRSEQL